MTSDPVNALFRWERCHEAVTRGGEEQPCEKPAVALRRDPEEGNRYPVCGYHTRANDPLMVTLTDLRAALHPQEGQQP